jgi:hypothetical protein
MAATENPFGAVKTGIVIVTGEVLPVKYDTVRPVWRSRRGVGPDEGPLVEPHVILGNG